MGYGDLRVIFVDDADVPGIVFSSNWTTRNSAFEEFGSYAGAPYRQSQSLTTTNSSLSFTYEGSDVILEGTASTGNISGRIDPDWECYFDGVLLERKSPREPYTENYSTLCKTAQIEYGVHTLTVNITSLGRPFFVDNVQYWPSPDIVTTSSNNTVVIGAIEKTFRTTGKWSSTLNETIDERVFENILYTKDPGSTVSIDFVGSKVTMYGIVSCAFTQGDSNGTYSIDGGPATGFDIPGIPRSEPSNPRVNQLFFQTGELDLGPHRLSMTYNGKGVPLVLDYLLVENGDLIERSIDPSTIPKNPLITPSDTLSIPSPSTASNLAGSPPSPGVIIGISVGAGLLLGLLVFLGLRHRKRCRREIPQTQGNDTLPNPFHIAPYDTESGPSTSSLPPNSTEKVRAVEPQPLVDVLRTGRYITEKTAVLIECNTGQSNRYANPPATTNHASSSPRTVSASLPTSAPATSVRAESTTDSLSISRAIPVVTRHEDSGLRGEVVVAVDLPPLYSER